MTDRTLLHAHRLWDRSRNMTVLMLVERVGGRRRVSFADNPKFVFHHSRPGALKDGEWPVVVEKSEVERCELPYDALPAKIAELAGERLGGKDLVEFRNWMSKTRPTARNGYPARMHAFPWLHGSDVDFEDFHHDVWVERHKDAGNSRLRRAFWDVEVDMGGFSGFPDPEEAPCPINAISLCRETADGGHVLECFLLNSSVKPNPEMDGFFADYDAKGGEVVRAALKELDPVPSSVRLYAFDDEMKMIKAFLRVAHDEDGPEILLAWNLSFDLRTLIGRIRNNGGDAEALLCHGVPPACREVAYRSDDKSEMFGKNDWWRVPSSVTHSCMLINYMRLRLGQGRLESYSLDAVLRSETGSAKAEYEGMLRDLCYSDYPAFVRYSLLDAHRLLLLDGATGDLDTLREISLLTRTRLERSMTKTVSLKNLYRAYLRGKGMILGNNRNAVGGKKSQKFLKGGFVAAPELNAKVGDPVAGKPSRHLFSDVCDFDFTSLYPSIIASFVVDTTTRLGRPGMMVGEEDGAAGWAADVGTGDPVLAGARHLGLPGYSELAEAAAGNPNIGARRKSE